MMNQTRLRNRDYSDMQSLMLPNYILQLRFWNRRSKSLPLQPSSRLLLVGECKASQLKLAECRSQERQPERYTRCGVHCERASALDRDVVGVEAERNGDDWISGDS